MSNNANSSKGGIKMIVSAIACVIVLAMGFLNSAGNNPDNQTIAETTSEMPQYETDRQGEKETTTPAATQQVEVRTTEAEITEVETTTAEITEAQTTAEIVVKEPFYFRTKNQWESHYEKHGIEMGFANKQEYLDAANKVIINPDALHKFEAEDGDDVYYVEATNEFVVVSRDGYIRTYFNPSDGIDYFNRQ